MSTPGVHKRDVLWHKYLSACHNGGTPEQRTFAFQRWWTLEKADAFASTKAELKATAARVAA